METYFDNEWVKVELLLREKTLRCTWKDAGTKIISFSDFEKIFDEILRGIKEYNIENWSDDTTDMGIIPVACQQWMVQDFFPKAIASGLKKVSIINSKDIFAVSAVKNVLNKVSKDLQVETFDNKSEAREWIMG